MPEKSDRRVVGPQIAVSAGEWSRELVRYTRNYGHARCRYAAIESRRLFEEHVDVFVSHASCSFLNAQLVLDLRDLGTQVVVVVDPEDFHSRGVATDMSENIVDHFCGADEVVSSGISTEDLLLAIIVLHETSVLDRTLATKDILGACGIPEESRDFAGNLARSTGRSAQEQEVLRNADPSPSLKTRIPELFHSEKEEQSRSLRTRSSCTVVVGSPCGGCGATEVSIALGHLLACRGLSSLLVEADDISPSLAQRLALDDDTPSIRRAILAVARQTLLAEDAAAFWPAGGFHVLTGVANSTNWRQVRPADMGGVLRGLAHRWPRRIVNIGHQLEDVRLDDYTGRYQMGREMVAQADVLVGVATHLVLSRLFEWLDQVQRLRRPGTPLFLLFNQIDPGDRRFFQSEITTEMANIGFSSQELFFAPFDTKVRRSAWNGECPGQGPFLYALTPLVETVFSLLPYQGSGRAWKRWSLRQLGQKFSKRELSSSAEDVSDAR